MPLTSEGLVSGMANLSLSFLYLSGCESFRLLSRLNVMPSKSLQLSSKSVNHGQNNNNNNIIIVAKTSHCLENGNVQDRQLVNNCWSSYHMSYDR